MGVDRGQQCVQAPQGHIWTGHGNQNKAVGRERIVREQAKSFVPQLSDKRSQITLTYSVALTDFNPFKFPFLDVAGHRVRVEFESSGYLLIVKGQNKRRKLPESRLHIAFTPV